MTSSNPPDLSRLRIQNKAANQPQQWSIIVWIVLGAFLVIAALFYARMRSTTPSAPNRPDHKINPPSSVPQTAPPARSGGVLDATGYVVAQRKAAVSSKATGRLKELKVVEGDTVQAGQVIGIIENEDVQALLGQEEAGLRSAEARVQAAQAEYDDAKVNHDRAKSLMDKSVIAQSELDTAESRYRKAAANVELAKADVSLAKARIEKAKVEFEFTLIRAPFAGTVLTKDADVGEIVAPFGSSTNARAALVTVADMDSLEVEADVSESNIAKIAVGQECSITLDSYPDKHYHGVVSRIVPTVDRAKATVQVKIRFTDKDAAVIPEMSARVAFNLDSSAAKSKEH